MNRLLSVTVLLLTLGALFSPTGCAAEGRKNRPLILGEKGRVGNFILGEPIQKYDVKRVGPRHYLSPDRAVELQTDSGGHIEKITVKKRGYFTDRFIRVGYSSLRSVLRHYGRPKDMRFKNQDVILEYPNYEFTFANARGNSSDPDMKELLDSRVSSITLKTQTAR